MIKKITSLLLIAISLSSPAASSSTTTSSSVITICSVPGPGTFMLYNSNDGTSSHQKLNKYLIKNKNNVIKGTKKFLPLQIGTIGISNHPDEAITGFDADLLVSIMAKANLPNYVLQVNCENKNKKIYFFFFLHRTVYCTHINFHHPFLFFLLPSVLLLLRNSHSPSSYW